MTLVELLWSSAELRSTEHFRLAIETSSATLAGVVVLEGGGVPGHLTYRVEVDGSWRTVAADAEIELGPTQRRRLEVADGRWTVDGVQRADLDGCVDVDLGWTPATNLLPIRRLELESGGAGRIDAAWLRYPELDVVRSTHSPDR